MLIGPQGIQGIQGVRGLQGLTGPTGIQGVRGIQGVSGSKGDMGPTGPQGTEGPQGVAGLPGGPTGWTGPTGVAGYIGRDGPTGDQGIQGPQGIEGLQGVQGNVGPQGVQGLQGVAGNTGPQGVQGIQGIQGVTGPSGTQGIDGFSGGLTLQMSYTTQAVPTDAVVETLAGSTSQSGNLNGTGTNARFTAPQGIAVDSAGVVYVCDIANGIIRKITSGVVTTFVSNITSPNGIAIDSSGTLYVCEEGRHRIIKISPAGVVTVFAGNYQGFANGTGTNALFSHPIGIAVDSSGNVFVADTNNNCIRKITPAGEVSTFAAGSGMSYPRGLTIDSLGNLYLANHGNHTILKITPTGVVTVFAGSTGQSGFADGTGGNARFNGALGITVDSLGNVFVSDYANQRVRKITPAGVVTTIAGNGSQGGADGVGTNASFFNPTHMGISPTGILYISSGHAVRRIAIGQDPNVFSGVPVTGTLLTTFNPSLPASTITIPASTPNAKVASFTLPVSSLPLKTSVTGVWSLVLYATVALSTSPASFYFEVVDGVTTVATGTTITSINQSGSMQMYKTNLTIPARTYTTDLTLNIYATTQPSSILTLGFNGSTISYLGTTFPSVGNTGPTGPAGYIGSDGATGATGPPGSTTGVTITSTSLASYSLAAIQNSVSIANATPTVIRSITLPSNVKGKTGLLSFFFNLFCDSFFYANQTLSYGLQLDGTALSFGDGSTVVPYTQTAQGTYAISRNGASLGAGGFDAFHPISLPVSIPSNATSLQLAIVNSSLTLSSTDTFSTNLSAKITYTATTVQGSPVSYTGTTTAYTVPAGVTKLQVFLWGGGGRGNGSSTAGGAGAHVSGIISVTPGATYYVYVGGKGDCAGIFTSTTRTQASCVVCAGGGGSVSNYGANSGGYGGVTQSGSCGIFSGTSIAAPLSTYSSPFVSIIKAIWPGCTNQDGGGSITGFAGIGYESGVQGLIQGGAVGGSGGVSYVANIIENAFHQDGGAFSSGLGYAPAGGISSAQYVSPLGRGVTDTIGTPGYAVIAPVVGFKTTQVGVNSSFLSN